MYHHLSPVDPLDQHRLQSVYFVESPRSRPPARTAHLVFIVLSCGAWTPVWVICEITHLIRGR